MIHKPGKDNVIADLLSRAVTICEARSVRDGIDPGWIAGEQVKDSGLVAKLQTDARYQKINGIICFGNPPRIVAPESCCSEGSSELLVC